MGPCSDSARPGPTPEAISNFLALVGRRVREIGRKLRRRTLASAGRGHQARLRRGLNFVDSSIPRGSTESTSGGRVYTRFHCREFLRERQKAPHRAIFFLSTGVGRWLGIIRPETHAPHWVQRTGFGQPFVASAQKVIFHGGILGKFGVVAR